MPELLLMILYVLLIAPVSATVEVSWQAGAELAVWGRVWGLPVDRHVRLTRGATGLTMEPDEDRSIAQRLRCSLADIGTVLRSNRARRYLLRHVQLLELDVLVRLSAGDAAHTAVLTGALQQLAGIVQRRLRSRARLVISPDFFTEQTRADMRCILFTRLGNLLIVAAAVYLARRLEQAEHNVDRAA